MKKIILLLSLPFLLTNPSFAKIIIDKDYYFIQTKQGDIPIMKVNTLLENKNINSIKIYGNANLISFATKGDPIKLYSIDEKGFTYSIEPFASATITAVENDGKVQFKEFPNRKYFIDPKGFFLY